MKNNTVLYILDFNLGDINGSQHLQVSLIEDLLKNKFNVTLIQSFKENSELPKTLEKYQNLKIINIQKKKYNKRNLLKRARSSKIYFNNIIKTISEEKIVYDYIYFLSTPITHYFVKKLKKTTTKPLIFHVQDLYPDTLETTMPFVFKFIINRLNKKQIKTFNNVDKIIVISEDIKDVLSNKGIEERKIYVVPNWFWGVNNIDDENNRFLNKFNINKNKFIIQYAGNFGRVLDYDAIIRFAKKIEEYDDIAIHFIGNGSKESYFKKLIKKSLVNNISFYPMQSFELVKDINSYADLCFIPLKNNVIYHSVPSKASIAHALGIPTLFVLNKESKYAMQIHENKVGFVIDYSNIDYAVNFVVELKNNKDIYDDYKENSIVYSQELKREKNTNKIIEIFKEIESRDE